MKKREMFVIIVVLVLLAAVLLLSGMFYFNFATGNVGTGHVVLADDVDNEIYSWEEPKKVIGNGRQGENPGYLND
ncbi:MAG: hypothetical protein ABIH92_04465 [Nanoarchaeota archaeon]